MTNSSDNMRNRLLLIAGCLTFLLALSATARFWNLTEVGISQCDPFIYTDESLDWAQGKPPFQVVRFAKFGFIYAGSLAVQLLGEHDYVLHALSAAGDTVSILLVFCIGMALGLGSLSSLSGACLYAFCPYALGMARSGYAHTLSAMALLLAFLFLVLSSRQGPLRLSMVLATGFAATLAVLMHPSLLLVFPFLAILCALSGSLPVNGSPWRFLGRSAMCLGVYMVGFLLCLFWIGDAMAVGDDTIFEGALGVLGGWLQHRTMNVSWFNQSTGVSDAWEYVPYWFSRTVDILSAPYLVLGLAMGVVFLVCRRRGCVRSEERPYGLAALWLVPLGLTVCLLALMHGTFRPRLFVPALPFVLLGIGHAGRIGLKRCLPHRGAMAWVLIMSLALAAVMPQFVRTATAGKGLYRQVHDAIGANVNADNRVLVTPYTAYIVYPGFRFRLYFGDDARYILKQEKGAPFEDLVKQLRVRYVVIAPRLHDERLFDWSPQDLGLAYGIQPGDYSMDKELTILAALLPEMGAARIIHEKGLEIWDLNPAAPGASRP